MKQPKKNAIPKYYCHKCGALCNIETRSHGFNVFTGVEMLEHIATCPTVGKVRWFEVPSHAYRESFHGYRPDDGDCSMGI